MPSTATAMLDGLSTSVALKAPVCAVTSTSITLSGLQTIGGVALTEDDRVLVMAQSNNVDNGIYTASTGSWPRARDFDGNRDVVKGTLVVTDGVSTALLFYRVTSANPIVFGTSAITFVQASEVQDPYPLSQAEIDAGLASVADLDVPHYWITRYGAVADKTTDNLAALNIAKAVAVYSKKIFIPAARAGYYYKLSNTWTLTDLDSVEIFGEGIQSLLVIANASGANCITVDSTLHATLRNFGIYGTAGCGHGIEVVNDSHYNTFENIWCGWVDGDAFKNTLGISNTYINCKADQNNGFRPASLVGLSDGSVKRGFYVPSTATGRNNNPTYIACHVNAAGETMSVQIGDNGGTPIESFNWHGGLIQGSANHREVYLQTRNSVIQGAHIESPVGVSVNWPVTFDACQNTVIRNTSLNGDVRMIGACRNSGIENASLYGVDVGSSCDRCFVRDSTYNNNSDGPADGLIKNAGARTDLPRLASSNDRYAVGYHIDNPTTYFATNMEDWVGGGSPTVPCGFSSFGTPTIARESTAAHVRSGTYSASITNSSELDEGLQIQLLPINQFAGRSVTIEAWVKNITTAGLAYIGLAEGGTGISVYQQSFLADVYERMLVTFRIDAAATSATLKLTGLIGTFKFDSVKITAEEHTPVTSIVLDGTATPSISYGGYHVPVVVTSGTPTITDFLNPHVNKPFLIRFTGATVITDGGSISLNGAGNFTGAAGDILAMVYGEDGIFRQLAPDSVL